MHRHALERIRSLTRDVRFLTCDEKLGGAAVRRRHDLRSRKDNCSGNLPISSMFSLAQMRPYVCTLRVEAEARGARPKGWWGGLRAGDGREDGRRVELLGIPMDFGQGRRGVDMG